MGRLTLEVRARTAATDNANVGDWIAGLLDLAKLPATNAWVCFETSRVFVQFRRLLGGDGGGVVWMKEDIVWALGQSLPRGGNVWVLLFGFNFFWG